MKILFLVNFDQKVCNVQNFKLLCFQKLLKKLSKIINFSNPAFFKCTLVHTNFPTYATIFSKISLSIFIFTDTDTSETIELSHSEFLLIFDLNP